MLREEHNRRILLRLLKSYSAYQSVESPAMHFPMPCIDKRKVLQLGPLANYGQMHRLRPVSRRPYLGVFSILMQPMDIVAVLSCSRWKTRSQLY